MKDALHAEWTKLRTAPGTWWLLAALVAATVGVSALAAGAAPAGRLDPVKVSLTGILLGQAVAAVAAVLTVGAEHSTGLARLTYTALPRRLHVLAGKGFVLTAVIMPASALAVAGSLLAGHLLLPEGLDTPAATVARAAVGSTLYLTLIALLSLAIATVTRQAGAAIGTVLGLLYVTPLLIEVVGDPDWHRRLHQIAPMSAGLAVQATRDLDALPHSPWNGLGVLAWWALGSLLAAALALTRRDI